MACSKHFDEREVREPYTFVKKPDSTVDIEDIEELLAQLEVQPKRHVHKNPSSPSDNHRAAWKKMHKKCESLGIRHRITDCPFNPKSKKRYLTACCGRVVANPMVKKCRYCSGKVTTRQQARDNKCSSHEEIHEDLVAQQGNSHLIEFFGGDSKHMFRATDGPFRLSDLGPRQVIELLFADGIEYNEHTYEGWLEAKSYEQILSGLGRNIIKHSCVESLTWLYTLSEAEIVQYFYQILAVIHLNYQVCSAWAHVDPSGRQAYDDTVTSIYLALVYFEQVLMDQGIHLVGSLQLLEPDRLCYPRIVFDLRTRLDTHVDCLGHNNKDKCVRVTLLQAKGFRLRWDAEQEEENCCSGWYCSWCGQDFDVQNKQNALQELSQQHWLQDDFSWCPSIYKKTKSGLEKIQPSFQESLQAQGVTDFLTGGAVSRAHALMDKTENRIDELGDCMLAFKTIDWSGQIAGLLEIVQWLILLWTYDGANRTQIQLLLATRSGLTAGLLDCIFRSFSGNWRKPQAQEGGSMAAYVQSGFTLIYMLLMHNSPSSKVVSDFARTCALHGNAIRGLNEAFRFLQNVVGFLKQEISSMFNVCLDDKLVVAIEKWSARYVDLVADFDTLQLDVKLCRVMVKELEVEGIRLVEECRKNKVSYTVLSAVQGKVRDLSLKLSKLPAPKPDTAMRCSPRLIHVYGPTGIGKTAMTDLLVTKIAQSMVPLREKLFTKGVASIRYNRQTGDPYWTNYEGQPIIVYDDFGTEVDTETKPNLDFQEILRVHNNAPFYPAQAAVEDKGSFPAEPVCVLCSSNRNKFAIKSMTNEEAVMRRFDSVWSLSVAPEYLKRDGTVDWENIQHDDQCQCGGSVAQCMQYMSFQERKACNGQAIGKPLNFREFSDKVVDSIKKHRAEQIMMLAAANDLEPDFRKEEQARAMYQQWKEENNIHNLNVSEIFHLVREQEPPADFVEYLKQDGLLTKMKANGLWDWITGKSSTNSRLQRLANRGFGVSVGQRSSFQIRQFKKSFLMLAFEEPTLAEEVLIRSGIPDSLRNRILDRCEQRKHDHEECMCHMYEALDMLEENWMNEVLKHWAPSSLSDVLLHECTYYVRCGLRRLWSWLGKNSIRLTIVGAMITTVMVYFSKFWNILTGIAGLSSLEQIEEVVIGDVKETEIVAESHERNPRVKVKPVIENVDSIEKKNELKLAEGGLDPASLALEDQVLCNMMTIEVMRDGQWVVSGMATVLGSDIAVTFGHLFDNPMLDVIKLTSLRDGESRTVQVSQLQRVRATNLDGTEKDVMFFKLIGFQAFKDISKHIMPSDIKHLIEHSPGSLIYARTSKLKSKTYVPMITHIGSIAFTETAVYEGVQQEYRLIDGYNYSTATYNGLCGALLMVLNSSVQKKLLGIHVCGYESICQGFAQSITVRDFDVAKSVLLPKANFQYDNIIQEHLTLVDEEDLGPSIVKKGELNYILPSMQKTALAQSLVYDEQVSVMMPAKLRPFEVGGRIVDPFALAYKKIEKVDVAMKSEILEDIEDVITERLVEVKNTQAKPIEHFRQTLTVEEAVFGSDVSQFMDALPLDTSPGYPWLVATPPGKGKKAWIDRDRQIIDPELREQIEKRLEKAKRGERDLTLWWDLLKDEKRPIEKVMLGKTRLFSCGPVDYTIVGRQYFLGFIAWCMENRISNGIGLGINVYTEWDLLVRYLRSTSNEVLECDFSNYDGSLPKQVLQSVCNIACKFYGVKNPEADLVRRTLWKEVTESHHIARNQILQWDGSLPSGFFATALANSIAQIICWMYVLNEQSIVFLDDFDDKVFIETYGDDGVLAFRFKVSVTQLQLIKQGFESIGMTVTTGDKKDVLVMKPVMDFSFLKRVSRMHFGKYMGALDKVSILEMTQWIRKGILSPVLLTSDNLKTAQREMAVWGKEDFDSFKEWAMTVWSAQRQTVSIRVGTFYGIISKMQQGLILPSGE